jgi:hypothetical protein
MVVDCDPLIRSIVRDDSLTRDLGDEEARMLVDWVVDWAELLIEVARSEEDAQRLLTRLCRRGRAIRKFVNLWCSDPLRNRSGATQLLASERFAWPLPSEDIDPPDLMQQILTWENDHPADTRLR